MKNRIAFHLALWALVATGYYALAFAQTPPATAAAVAQIPKPPETAVDPQTKLIKTKRDAWGEYIGQQSTHFFRQEETLAKCPDKADYDCTGIMLSGFEPQDDPLYWTKPNPPSNKISLTYFIQGTLSEQDRVIYSGAGFMLWPRDALAEQMRVLHQENNAFPTVYRCIFPADAFSDVREDSGCGAVKDEPTTGPCQGQGIDSAQAWLAAFGDGDKFTEQCGFTLQVAPAADKKSLAITTEIQQTLIKERKATLFGSYNEVLMKPWDADRPQSIPLFGFFYVEPDSKKYLVTQDPKKIRLTPGGDLAQVQMQQRVYYEKTQIFAPIIQMSGQSWSKATFSYVPELQAKEIPADVNVLPQ